MDISKHIAFVKNTCLCILLAMACIFGPFSHAQTNTTQAQPKAEKKKPLSKRQLKKLERKLARTVYVTEPFANVRTGPGRGYPVIYILEKNEAAIILKERTDWLKIETKKGQTGWVNSARLEASFDLGGEPIAFQKPKAKGFSTRRFEFGMLGGNLEGASSITNYFSYYFTKNISGELTYSQSFGNFSTRKLASINIVHQMFPDWRVSPFFLLGTGLIQTAPDADLAQSQDREDNTISTGAGVFIKVSRRFLIRIEYDFHTALTTRAQNEEVEEWKAGFGVYF